MKDKKFYIILFLLIAIPIIWVALLIAPYTNGGIVTIMRNLTQITNNPFEIELTRHNLMVVLFFILIYILGIGIYLSSKRKYRRGEEYGSALWGIASQINKKYSQKPIKNNKILTQNINIGLKAQKHRRNLNTLVCGGSRCRKNKIFC